MYGANFGVVGKPEEDLNFVGLYKYFPGGPLALPRYVK